MRRLARAAILAAALGAGITSLPRALRADELIVGQGGRFATITAALEAARPGDRVLVRAGTYREPTLIVTTPRVTVEGQGWPVLDGQGEREVLVIAADDVTVRGVVAMNTGISNLEDRAGIRARDVRNCLIERNRLRQNLWGIYLQRSANCIVRDNDLEASGARQTESGN
ncbi:MAG: right-handed parallel beta-helix repeat-containing protein, partial [Gemmatimonadetes bacterium]|nr:right-handed parallel beta-helix repeat-containing protein [Gemmatimonadota bacterium]